MISSGATSLAVSRSDNQWDITEGSCRRSPRFLPLVPPSRRERRRLLCSCGLNNRPVDNFDQTTGMEDHSDHYSGLLANRIERPFPEFPLIWFGAFIHPFVTKFLYHVPPRQVFQQLGLNRVKDTADVG